MASSSHESRYVDPPNQLCELLLLCLGRLRIIGVCILESGCQLVEEEGLGLLCQSGQHLKGTYILSTLGTYERQAQGVWRTDVCCKECNRLMCEQLVADIRQNCTATWAFRVTSELQRKKVAWK